MNSVTNLVNERIKEVFGEQTENFKIALQKSNAIIAGSFIPQSILQEYWNDSDIDIYVPISSNAPANYDNLKITDNIKFEINEEGDKIWFSYGGCLITEIEKFLYELSNKKDTYHIQGCYFDDFGKSLCGIRAYEIGNTKIQVMQIRSKLPIHTFILRTFDFDICKSYYQIVENTEMVVCADLNGILKKTCEFNYCLSLKNTVHRYFKYVLRGFTFTCDGIDIPTLFSDFLKSSNMSYNQNNKLAYNHISMEFLKRIVIKSCS